MKSDCNKVDTWAQTAKVAKILVDVDISGGWDDTFSSQVGATILDGENARRVILTGSGIQVTLDRINSVNGTIENSANLSINDSTISGFKGQWVGIRNWGTLTFTNSTIREGLNTGLANEAQRSGTFD